MNRKTNAELKNLVDSYGESKKEENAIVKRNKERNSQIKQLFLDNDISSFETDSFIATVSETEKQSLNNELALGILKKELGENELTSVVKTKEYIDEDALEKLVFNGQFDISKLEKAVDKKIVSALRIKARKWGDYNGLS